MTNEFLDYIIEQLEPMGGVGSKKMFGGYSLQKNDLSIGIFFEGTLYLKVDDSNRREYEEAGSEQFSYEKGGKTTMVSNWAVPEWVIEDKDEFIRWAEKAYGVAVRAKR